MSSAVAGRHLMLWSKNPVDQAAWVVSGVSGSLTDNSVDVSLINVEWNKLDQYIPIDVAVTTAPTGSGHGGHLDHPADQHHAPGQSQYIAGPFPGVPVAYGGYYGLVAANLPAAASRHLDDRCRPAGGQGGRGSHLGGGGAADHCRTVPRRRWWFDSRCPDSTVR